MGTPKCIAGNAEIGHVGYTKADLFEKRRFKRSEIDEPKVNRFGTRKGRIGSLHIRGDVRFGQLSDIVQQPQPSSPVLGDCMAKVLALLGPD